MRGAYIRLSRMMPVPLRLPHNYTPVFFNTLVHILSVAEKVSHVCRARAYRWQIRIELWF